VDKTRRFIDDDSEKISIHSLKLKDCELVIPHNLFFLWLGEERRFLGVVDASTLIADTLREKGMEDFTDCLLANINVFPHDVNLAQLANDNQVVYPLLNTNGSLSGFLDRTQLLDFLNNESGLKLSELEAVFSSAHNGIVSINSDGIITAFNPAAEKLSGIPKEKAVGKYIADVLVPTGLLDVLSTGKSELSTKFQVGKRKYITNRTPIIQNGRITGAVGVFQEISEIDRISQELNSVKELNKELSAILESSYDGVIVTDMQGIVLKANRACERIIGLQEGEMVNRSIQELTDNGIFSKRLIDKVEQGGKPVTSLVSTSNENALLVTASPVSDEKGRVYRVVINVRDMTELTQLRHQLRYTKELSDQYHSELTELKSKFILEPGIIASSRSMQDLISLAIRVASFDSSVLLLGESGVGKEVIAKLIHDNSNRSKHPFVKINCGAIPENLLEAELFGYEPGSFTGANKVGKMGLFEVANKGTLLLDEVGDIPFKLQVKLLRVLQEREVLRVGSSTPRMIDVRIIAATNHNLQNLVEVGSFRQDLYFRLHVVPIRIPPLRERREDIVPIVYSLLKKLEKKYHLKKEFSPEAIDLLVSSNWAGNIRELENVVEQLFVTCLEDVITPQNMSAYLLQTEMDLTSKAVAVNRLMPLKEAIEELENQLISKAMLDLGNTYKAAEALAVNQSTIWRKWKKIQKTENRHFNAPKH
jgi:PAS domain S-box-containing protein